MVFTVNNRVSISLRTIPLLLYGVLIFYSFTTNQFDFWTPMININQSIINWFLAGLFNVVLIFILLYIRLLIVRFSFEDLNDKIPHSDLWELIQFYVTIAFTLLVVINGILLTTMIYSSKIFIWIQLLLIFIPFIIDVIFHIKWILI